MEASTEEGQGVALEQDLPIPARDGYPLAATLRAPPSPRAVVVLASATGVGRAYYAAFARHLADHGFAVLTFDYRGIGGSRPGGLRGFAGGMADWGELDLAGVIDWLPDSAFGHLPALFVGHSVGGQILPLADNAVRLRAAYLVASQSGHWRHWEGWRRVHLGFMWHVGVPGVVAALGRLPAALLGGGEDLPPRVALDWARWGRDRRYVLGHRPDTPARFAAIGFPLRIVSFTDDPLAPRRAVDALAGYYRRAPVQRRVVAPTELGARGIGHFGFFRARVGAPLWADALAFLEDHA
jgi:predicted alpha/beta hydrolase